MKKGLKTALALPLCLSAAIPVLAGEQSVTLEEAFKASKPLFDVRLRYEGVDQDGLSENAEALTYRVRAGLETGAFWDTKFLIDFEHTQDLIGDFNSSRNGMGTFPVVADPNVTELNRLQLTNTSLPDTTLTLGRQRIIHPSARFVGNVGWRQDEQTYDALRVVNKSVNNLTLDASYIDRVNRIFADDGATNTGTTSAFKSDSWLLNAGYKIPSEVADIKISGFSYLLDFENSPENSSQTYGMSAALKTGIATLKGTYAVQSDYRDQPVNYTADYYHIEAGAAKKGFTGAAGYEVLGSDNGVKAFQTPLATLHAYNGWADKFLVTPAGGIQDIYIKAGYKTKPVGVFAPISFTAVYHDYSADQGGLDYGAELDFSVGTGYKKAKLLLKYADYKADSFGTDTQKFWAQIACGF